MSTVWINGQFVEDSSAALSIRDAGLLHGAGVFTTMRAYAGRVMALDRHLARLRQSCQSLFIPLTPSDEILAAAAGELLKKNNLSDARLRLTATRGTVRRDPLHGTAMSPSLFLTAAELEKYPPVLYERGMTVILLDEQKLNPYDVQAGHKTLNYLSRLHALRNANERSANEALWFNVHNYLQSGCMSNVFMVKNGELLTPPTSVDLRESPAPYPRSNVLPGVTRSIVIELAASAGINVRFAAINVNELLEADEVFLTNSVMQIMPVCRIERRAVGDDRPGKITLALAAAYDARVQSETGNPA
jgi:branched-chain amino acid aminotransferase